MEGKKWEELTYEYWLAAIGISDNKKTLLREYMKSAREVYYIEETHLQQFRFLNEKDRNTMIQAKKIGTCRESVNRCRKREFVW